MIFPVLFTSVTPRGSLMHSATRSPLVSRSWKGSGPAGQIFPWSSHAIREQDESGMAPPPGVFIRFEKEGINLSAAPSSCRSCPAAKTFSEVGADDPILWSWVFSPLIRENTSSARAPPQRRFSAQENGSLARNERIDQKNGSRGLPPPVLSSSLYRSVTSSSRLRSALSCQRAKCTRQRKLSL